MTRDRWLPEDTSNLPTASVTVTTCPGCDVRVPITGGRFAPHGHPITGATCAASGQLEHGPVDVAALVRGTRRARAGWAIRAARRRVAHRGPLP